jgi:hypothetical protein
LYRFDTSALGAAPTIDSVLVKIVLTTKNLDNNFFIKLIAADDTVTTTTFHVGQYHDFEGWKAGATYVPTILSDSLSATTYTDGDTLVFHLNAAGITEINEIGTTQFYLLSGQDIANITPKKGVEPSYYEDFLLEDDSPYMMIYYTVASGFAGKVAGVIAPAKVSGVALPTKINGVD